MIRLVKILIFVAWSTPLWSQIPAEEPIDYIYRSHWYLGPRLASNGLGFDFHYERRFQDKLRHGFEFSVSQIKAHKESRITNPYYEESKSYVFGKINQVYTLRLSYLFTRSLFEQKRFKGVSIRYKQSVGLSLGLLKPVYVKIKEPFIEDITIKPTDERYDPTIHTEEYVFGRSSMFMGFSELTKHLGACYKTGFQFDFNANKSHISAVEIGVQMDIFPRKLTMFYTGKNRQFHPALYATVQLGKNKI